MALTAAKINDTTNSAAVPTAPVVPSAYLYRVMGGLHPATAVPHTVPAGTSWSVPRQLNHWVNHLAVLKTKRLVQLALCAALIGGCWQALFARRVGIAERSQETPHFQRMVDYHERSVGIVPNGAVVFIGDSITQGLCVAAVTSAGVNYGIGGDTTTGVLRRLNTYEPALSRASALIIAIGINDLPTKSNDEILTSYTHILRSLPEVHVIVSSVLPVDESGHADRKGWNDRIREVNRRLGMLAKRHHCHFVDNQASLDRDADGSLDSEFHVGDGIHLNSKGNATWAANLRGYLRSSSQAAPPPSSRGQVTL